MWSEQIDIMGQWGCVYVGEGVTKQTAELIIAAALDRVGLVVIDNGAGPGADRLVADLVKAGLEVRVLRVPGGEQQKGWGLVSAVYDAAIAGGVGRDGWILAIGGGALSDAVGFAAATYLRGVVWGVLPTTLLAQVDASIGGKTAIDLPQGKNLVGAFHLPRWVLVDPDWLGSLPPSQWRSGWGELIKTGLLVGKPMWTWVQNAPPAWESSAGAIALIETAVAHKVKVVAEDPREQGVRAYLNLGHTIGHAWEASGQLGQVQHGEAVGVGLLGALRLSELLLGFPDDYRLNVHEILQRWSMPTELRGALASRLLTIMTRDKKKKAGQIRWVLMNDLAQPTLAPVPPDLVYQVLRELGASTD